MSDRHPKDLQRDMRRLKAMLGQVLETDSSPEEKLPNLSGEELRILDLACGACDEAEALTDFFASIKSPEDRERAIKLVGLDVREREIGHAKERFRSRRDARRGIRKKFEFLAGDATKLQGHRELEKDFDVVFMRHQNLWNGQRTWEEIFDHALHKLDADGKLIITSYFDREHEQALEVIQNLGGELLRTVRNPDSRVLITPGKSIDRHVAVFKRKGG